MSYSKPKTKVAQARKDAGSSHRGGVATASLIFSHSLSFSLSFFSLSLSLSRTEESFFDQK